MDIGMSTSGANRYTLIPFLITNLKNWVLIKEKIWKGIEVMNMPLDELRCV